MQTIPFIRAGSTVIRSRKEEASAVVESNLGATYSVVVFQASDDQRMTLTEQLWATEIEQRAKRVLDGNTRGEPWDRVRARIEQELTGG